MRNEKKNMFDNTIIVRHEITINENSNKFMFYDTENFSISDNEHNLSIRD